MRTPRLIHIVTRSTLFVLVAACVPSSEVAELGVYEGTQTGTEHLGDASFAAPNHPELPDASELPPAMQPTDPAAPAPVCHRFAAHAAGSSEPYPVPAQQAQYVRFTFDAPWKGEQFIQSVKPLLGERRVVHHWMLYAEPRALPTGVETASEPKRTGALVYGWVPGSSMLELPADYGIAAPDGVSYTLEVRYYNVDGPATVDATSVEVCLAAQRPFFAVSLQQLEDL